MSARPNVDERTDGCIDVTQGGSSTDCTGYGFGNRVRMDDVQGYVWAGKPVEKGVIEIAVTSEPLTASEKERLLSN